MISEAHTKLLSPYSIKSSLANKGVQSTTNQSQQKDKDTCIYISRFPEQQWKLALFENTLENYQTINILTHLVVLISRRPIPFAIVVQISSWSQTSHIDFNFSLINFGQIFCLIIVKPSFVLQSSHRYLYIFMTNKTEFSVIQNVQSSY